MFCNSQILSQTGMSKPIKEDNDANLLATENHIFDRLMDAMQDHYQSMYAFIDCHVHHLSNYCDNAQPVDPAFNNALTKSGTQKEDIKSNSHLTNHTNMSLTDHSELFKSAMNRKRQRNNHRLTT
jgi:hypothetical protein